MSNDWAEADEFSDRIIELFNERIKLGTNIDQLLVGACLGLLGFLNSAPDKHRMPEWLTALQTAADLTITVLADNGPQPRRSKE